MKQFPPSSKRIKEARKGGKIVKSRLLTVALQLVGVLVAYNPIRAWVGSGSLVLYWQNSSHYTPVPLLYEGALTFSRVSVTLFLVVTIFGLLSELIQTRGSFFFSLLSPKPERVWSIQRIKSGIRNIPWNLFNGLILGFAISFVCIRFFREFFQLFLVNKTSLVFNSVSLAERCGLQLIATAATTFGILGTLEFLRERSRFLRENSMSYEEIRSEIKEEEGDPYVKSHRRNLHRSILNGSLAQRVRRSSVIIVARANGRLNVSKQG